MNKSAPKNVDGQGPNSAAMLPKLPPDIKIMEFARHRAQELASLTAAIEHPGGSNKRIFQQLPRHMRRRAMSHSIKRVPRRLQEIQKRELEKFGKKASKRPSRKHRRRPSQLLQAYNRRQRDFIWLETHIWHAKRFKMIPRWGYKIPWHPNDKSIRACYRAATRAVLLQDLSYYCCIELNGPRQAIVDVLNRMTNPDCGLTFSSKMCASGCREGATVVYRCNRYPSDAICPVKFLWRHAALESDEESLWVWAHPSGFKPLLDELVTAFGLQRDDGEQKPSDKEKLELLQQKQYEKLAPKLRPFYEHNPVYRSETVALTVLKDTLVRFRLLGQGSTAILAATLKVTEYPDVGGVENQKPQWWTKLDSSFKAEHSEQVKMWENLSKCPFASRVAPSSVIGLTVHDPREALPVTRNKIAPKVVCQGDEMGPLELKPQLSSSALWIQEVRDEITFTKMSDCEMNKLRSQFLVPGTPLNLGNKGSRIPIMLIQQPGNMETTELHPIGVGWDIILPAGWAMAFWIPFVYHCARVGGYREHETVTRELHLPHFPDDYPDTSACREVEEQQSQELIAKYFRYPPDKRPNFVKLCAKTPFSFPWQQLVSEWAASSPLSNLLVSPPLANGRYFVLRSQKLLCRLRTLCHDSSRKKFQRREHSKNVPKFEGACWDDVLRPEHRFSLVPVRLYIVARGEVRQFSMVCEPTKGDLKMLEKTADYSSPCEAHRKDDLKDLRKETLENAKRSRKKAKSGDENALEAEVRSKLDRPVSAEDNFNELYVPSSSTIIGSCSRTIVGFAKSGSFSFSRGKTIGFAFVAFPALFRLLKDASENCQEPLLLVRAPHSFQYHYAHFDI